MNAANLQSLTRANALIIADSLRSHSPRVVKDRAWHGFAKSVLRYSNGLGILNVEADRVVFALRLEISMMPPGALPSLESALSILSPS